MEIINFLKTNSMLVIVAITGIVLVVGNSRLNNTSKSDKKIENENSIQSISSTKIFVDLSGAVNEPGVFEMPAESHIKDVIEAGGGFSDKADAQWVAKYLNLAERLIDGSKIYVPYGWEASTLINVEFPEQIESIANASSESTSTINVNLSSKEDLMELEGIGDVYAQKIIDNRPYKDFADFISKSKLSVKLVEKLKPKITF